MDIASPTLKEFLIFSFFYLMLISGCMLLIVIIVRKRIQSHKIELELVHQKFENEKKQIELQTAGNVQTRIAMELHDDLSPSMATINIMAELLKTDNTSEEDKEYIEHILKVSKNVQLKIRSLSHLLSNNIRNEIPIEESLHNLVRPFSEISGCKYAIELNGNEIDLPSDHKTSILTILKELIYNSYKYSGAKENNIKINLLKDEVAVKFYDNGVGLQDEKSSDGIGLNNIKQRIELYKGNYTINGENGFQFDFNLPYKQEKKKNFFEQLFNV